MARRNAGRFDIGLCIVFPVVVRRKERPVRVVQREHRIIERVRQLALQRCADRAHQDSGAGKVLAGNKSSDQDIVTRFGKAARADIRQDRINR